MKVVTEDQCKERRQTTNEKLDDIKGQGKTTMNLVIGIYLLIITLLATGISIVAQANGWLG